MHQMFLKQLSYVLELHVHPKTHIECALQGRLSQHLYFQLKLQNCLKMQLSPSEPP